MIEQTKVNFFAKHKKNIPELPDAVFLATELSQEPLVNYLARVHESNENRAASNDDLTSIFRTGLSSNNQIQLHRELNGWIVYGAIYYYDAETNTICLPLVLSSNRIADIKSSGADGEHAIHLAVINWLTRNTQYSGAD